MLQTSTSYKIAHRTTKSKILKKNPCASVIFVQRQQKSPLFGCPTFDTDKEKTETSRI